MTQEVVGEVTDEVVDFVAGLTVANIPPSVAHEITRSFVDSVGCIVGGSSHAAVQTATASLKSFFGRDQATLLGQGAHADTLHAALINGLAGASYSFFDSYSSAHLHAGVAHAAGLLAVAESTHASGPEFVAAFAAGVEIACRLTNALAEPPAEADVGWSVGGIVCGVSTALAAGKLLGLNRQRLTWALGIAASEAAGTRAEQGAMTAGLIYGQAAQTGVRAALMASHGFTSSDRSLEARHGYLNLFSRKPYAKALLTDLGSVFHAARTTYKPFPTDIAIHPAIDAMLKLKGRRSFDGVDIRSIQVFASDLAARFCDRPAPANALEAKFSLQHWLAASAVHGRAGLEQGRDEVVWAPEVRHLGSLTQVVEDADLSWDAARLVIQLVDGTELVEVVDHCVGSPESPLSDASLEDKFVAQVSEAIGQQRAVGLVAECWSVAALDDVGALAQAAR